MLETITKLNAAQRDLRDAKSELKKLIETMGQPESSEYREMHILLSKPWKLKGSSIEVMDDESESYEGLDAVVNSYVSDDKVVVFDVFDCCMSSMDGYSAYIILSKANQLGEIGDNIICRTR